MKKGIKIALKLIILLFAINVFMNSKVNAETESVNGLEWTYTVEDGKAVDVYISRGVITNIREITVPTELGGYPVVRIGNPLGRNFINGSRARYLNTIYLPSSLEEIGNSAFNGISTLQVISSGIDTNDLVNIKEIGNYAFSSCTALTQINLPDTLTSIGNNAFYQCSNLSKINIPDSTRNIGESAFYNCRAITSITLPEGITKINTSTFQNCSSLTNVNLPQTLVEIGNYAFQNCSSLDEVNMQSTLLTTIGYGVFSNTGLTEIPNNINIIGNSMFANCKNMTSIVLPEEVTTIEMNAFQNCTNLTSIVLSDTIQKIENYAFSGTGLTEIPEKLENIVTEIPAGLFANCKNITDLVIPEGITKINSSAFQGCTNLENVKLPETLSLIYSYAFSNCTNLRVDLEDSNPEIKDYAFSGVSNLYVNREEGEIDFGETNATIHYPNCRHTITTNIIPGIKIINTDTDEEIVGVLELDCGSSINYKIVIEENLEYDNLCYVLSKEPSLKYSTIDKINKNEETINIINTEHTDSIQNISRDSEIIVQNIKTEGHLVLRKYITKVNSLNVNENRESRFEIVNGERQYKHTKQPVIVNSGDIIRYTIRIYNEGRTNAYVNEITEYLPEGLEFVSSSAINSKYKWKVSEDGRIITSDYLSKGNSTYNYNPVINAYTGSSVSIQYKELELECKVLANRDEENKYISSITEITLTDPEDIDGSNGNVTIEMLEDYKKEESLLSNSDSYIHGEDDDLDYECILVPTISDISTDYRIRIEKIDGLTGEMLNGAKFNLLSEAGEVLKEGVTAVDGVLDFGMMNSVGEGTDTYYIEEVQRPEGYNNPLTYKVKLTVTREIYDYINEKYTLDVKCDIADIDVDVTRYDAIPIYTKEQLIKIGSNEEVYIEEADETFKFDNTMVYKLMQDIDLLDTEWTPLNAENCMLDGNNFAIKNLNIVTDLQNIEKVGLFSTYSGYIGNLTLENVNINAKLADVEYTEPLYTVGGLVGYMSEGIIKNCNVTGEITANIDNVGGFVGHSEKGKIVIFNDCINTANVSTQGNNVGGLIGCVKGAISINKSTNKGNISTENTKKVYNAGGLIGCADPDSYETDIMRASYDKENKIITVVVKNDSIIGKYKLKLENVDIQTLNLIEGSTFDILDKDKNVVNGYKGVVLTDGKLDVATIDITTIGTDVYYIKQIATPEGYEVSTNEYVKVIVNKKWDTVNDKYVVEVDTTIINDEDYEIDEVPEDVSSSKTGIIHKIMEYKNITWTTNKVGIKDSKNEGRVYSYGYNAAGLVGRGKTSILIENCENIGEIVSTGHAGGLLGEITKVNELSFVDIYNSNNKGKILGEANKSIYGNVDNEIGGILAYSEANLKIDNCSNEGIISSLWVSAGGIVGNSIGNTEIYNCNNTGTVSVENGSSSITAGIISKRFRYEDKADKTIIIDNCYNSGNISGLGHVAGILGIATGEFMELTNCTVENCEMIVNGENNCSIGGIVCEVAILVINIDNCNINNIDINNCSSNQYTQTGGILADVNVMLNYSDIYTNKLGINLNISKCNVNDSNIVSNFSNLAGILAFGGYGAYQNDIYIYIYQCNVSNSEVKSQSETGAAVSGIYGQGYEIRQVVIDSCNVTESTITLEKESKNNMINVAGIYGTGYNYGENNTNILIKNSQVISSNIYNKAIGSGSFYGVNTGGILANSYIQGKNIRVDIIESKVYDCDIQANSGNVGGIYNLAMSNQQYLYSNIMDCTVEKTTINSLYNYTANDCMGGIAGAINVPTVFTNCNVIDSTITNNECTNTAGIVALAFENTEFVECNVKNTDIKSKSTKSTVAGIVSVAYYDTHIYKCNISDLEMEGNGAQLAGILNYSNTVRDKGVVIEESNIDNVKFTLNATPKYNYTSFAGIVTGAPIGKYQIKNCNVLNSNVNSNATSTGGIMACAAGRDTNISGCKVENVTINTGSERNNGPYGDVGGIVADIIGQPYDTGANIDNCIVKDTQIESTSDQIGGVISTITGNVYINDCTIENVELKNTNNIEIVSPLYKRNIGGIVGAGPGGDNFNITNPTINGLTITAEEGENDIIQTGGIVGAGYRMEIDNANITGLNITNNTPNGLVGGIAGVASDGSNQSANVEIKILNSNITDSILKGLNHIGGCIGFTTLAEIDETTVNNTSLTTSEETGIVGGFVGAVTNNEKEISSGSTRESKVTITNSKLIDIVQTGLNYVDEFIGLGTAEKTNTTVSTTPTE